MAADEVPDELNTITLPQYRPPSNVLNQGLDSLENSHNGITSNAITVGSPQYRGRWRLHIVAGDEVSDAGSEVNDELPMNTAFFGQMVMMLSLIHI